MKSATGTLSKKASSGLLPCLLDELQVATDPHPITECLPMPKSRGCQPEKNRAPATFAPTRRLNNFNNTPQVSPFSTQPARSRRQERHCVKSSLHQS